MQNFKNLHVWEKSHALTLRIYEITISFPKTERYGLMNQMRRSASSIPSNIAEGCGHYSQRQFVRYLNIAFGSASELEYQVILSKDLNFIDADIFKELHNNTTEIKRMLSSLIQKVITDN